MFAHIRIGPKALARKEKKHNGCRNNPPFFPFFFFSGSGSCVCSMPANKRELVDSPEFGAPSVRSYQHWSRRRWQLLCRIWLRLWGWRKMVCFSFFCLWLEFSPFFVQTTCLAGVKTPFPKNTIFTTLSMM